MRRLINKLIQSLGRKSYSLDLNLSSSDILVILVDKAVQLFRGLLLRLCFHEVKGILFVGKNCNFKFKNKIKLGKSVQISNWNIIIHHFFGIMD